MWACGWGWEGGKQNDGFTVRERLCDALDWIFGIRGMMLPEDVANLSD